MKMYKVTFCCDTCGKAEHKQSFWQPSYQKPLGWLEIDDDNDYELAPLEHYCSQRCYEQRPTAVKYGG